MNRINSLIQAINAMKHSSNYVSLNRFRNHQFYSTAHPAQQGACLLFELQQSIS